MAVAMTVVALLVRGRAVRRYWPVSVAVVAAAHLAGQATPIIIEKVTPAPEWARAERQMLDAASGGVQLWLSRYVKPDDSVDVPERWGVTDGPDDIMETVRGWPLVYAMGASESVAEAYERVWEGHLRQFGRAKIPTVELAKDRRGERVVIHHP